MLHRISKTIIFRKRTHQILRYIGRYPVEPDDPLLVLPIQISPSRGRRRRLFIAVAKVAVVGAVAELELLSARAQGTVEDLADKVDPRVVLLDDVVLGLAAVAVLAGLPVMDGSHMCSVDVSSRN